MSDVETPVSNPMMSKLGAEALGTFVLVFCGAATAVLSNGNLATPLAFGLAYLVMAYAVGYISGGHFNPAVSVGLAVSGRISWRQAGLYAAAQLVGAFLAGLLLFAVLHGFEGFDSEGSMGQNFFGEENPAEFAVWAALLVEILATLLFVAIFLAIADERHPNRAVAPLVVGLSLAVIYFATVGMTGGSANPARSIGVGLFAGGDAVLQLWLFIIAPLLGALAAGLAYPAVFGRDSAPVAGSGLHLSQLRRPREAAHDPQQQWDAQQQWQTEYPGWRWDAAAQQWVPDPTTAPQQWSQPDEAATTQTDQADPYAGSDDAATTQLPTRDRPEDEQQP